MEREKLFIPLDNLSHFNGTFLTYTANQNLDHVEELVQRLPDWKFIFTARTFINYALHRLVAYPNVRIYDQATNYVCDQLYAQTDIYLDINEEPKVNSAIENAMNRDLPVWTFDRVKTLGTQDYPNYHIFPDDGIEQLVNQAHLFIQQRRE